MGDLYKAEKVCGFHISSMHFLMMVLPFINKELKNEKEIITIFEYKLDGVVSQILDKLTIEEDLKEEISKINWQNVNINKAGNIDKIIKRNLGAEKDLDILICGNEKYINKVNLEIEKVINKNIKKIREQKIKIVDSYQVNDFKENVKEILDMHDKVFNTSGEHEINEVFEDYHSA